jgi:hypothetical protein
MSTTPTPPIVPPDDDDSGAVDSAEADRLASQGEDPEAVEAEEAEHKTTSADADWAASRGADPQTD